MKKYALMGILGMLVVGCASTPKPPAKPFTPSTTRIASSPATQTVHYQCDQGVHIKALHSLEPKPQGFAKIVVHAPILGLDHQPVELLQVGSALDKHYINDKNPDSVYHWHTKDTHGYFLVNASGTEYGYRCQANP